MFWNVMLFSKYSLPDLKGCSSKDSGMCDLVLSVWVIFIWNMGEENIFFKEGRQESKGRNNSEYLKVLSLKMSFGPDTQALDIEQRKQWKRVQFEGIDISGTFTEDRNILGIQVKSNTAGLSVVVLVRKQLWKAASFVDRVKCRKWHKEKCKRGRNWQNLFEVKEVSHWTHSRHVRIVTCLLTYLKMLRFLKIERKLSFYLTIIMILFYLQA